jgi:hypothetical protein
MAEKKYFLFSPQQQAFRKQTELKLGRTFKPGQVIVNGRRKAFTELTTTPPEKLRYSDYQTVYYGDPTKVKYTMPTSV